MGWEVREEPQEGGDIRAPMADSWRCMAETNTPWKSNNPPIKIVLKKCVKWIPDKLPPMPPVLTVGSALSFLVSDAYFSSWHIVVSIATLNA